MRKKNYCFSKTCSNVSALARHEGTKCSLQCFSWLSDYPGWSLAVELEECFFSWLLHRLDQAAWYAHVFCFVPVCKCVCLKFHLNNHSLALNHLICLKTVDCRHIQCSVPSAHSLLWNVGKHPLTLQLRPKQVRCLTSCQIFYCLNPLIIFWLLAFTWFYLFCFCVVFFFKLPKATTQTITKRKRAFFLNPEDCTGASVFCHWKWKPKLQIRNDGRKIRQ